MPAQQQLYDELKQARPGSQTIPCDDAQRRISHLADVAVRFTSLPLVARDHAEGRFRSSADDVLAAAPRDCWADKGRLRAAIEDMSRLLDERGAVPSTAEAYATEMREGAGGAALEHEPRANVRCVSGRDESDLESRLGEELITADGQPTDLALTEGGMGRLYACLMFSE